MAFSTRLKFRLLTALKSGMTGRTLARVECHREWAGLTRPSASVFNPKKQGLFAMTSHVRFFQEGNLSARNS